MEGINLSSSCQLSEILLQHFEGLGLGPSRPANDGESWYPGYQKILDTAEEGYLVI